MNGSIDGSIDRSIDRSMDVVSSWKDCCGWMGERVIVFSNIFVFSLLWFVVSTVKRLDCERNFKLNFFQLEMLFLLLWFVVSFCFTRLDREGN